MKNKTWIVTVILFPILMLFSLTIYKHYKANYGTKIIIPISGYDPRDLLSGHYITYRLDLNIDESIRKISDFYDKEAYIYIKQTNGNNVKSKILPYHDFDEPGDYDVIIKGKFRYNRFEAGIEKFYIPERHAGKLDTIIRSGKGKIVVSVDNKGNASIRDLLINDKPWKDYLEE